MQYIKATKNHIPQIVTLLEKYHKDQLSPEEQQDGFVTARLSAEKLEELFEQGNIAIVAVEGDQVLGVMMAGPWRSWVQIPLFSHMAEGLSQNSVDGTSMTTENSCLYGPVCLERSVRGNGVFEQLFEETLKTVSKQSSYMVAFIAKSNPRSYAAHTRKTTLKVTGEFCFENEQYYYLACATCV